MSVLIVGRYPGDTAKFRQALAAQADEFAKFGEQAQAAGMIRHRSGVGDGFVIVVDEWESG